MIIKLTKVYFSETPLYLVCRDIVGFEPLTPSETSKARTRVFVWGTPFEVAETCEEIAEKMGEEIS